jgi:hypothetical protein
MICRYGTAAETVHTHGAKRAHPKAIQFGKKWLAVPVTVSNGSN